MLGYAVEDCHCPSLLWQLEHNIPWLKIGAVAIAIFAIWWAIYIIRYMRGLRHAGT